MRYHDLRTWEDVQREGRRLWEERRSELLGVPFRARTWLNVAYLLVAAPLGGVYFTILSIGLSIGLMLLPILIGIPILLVTLVVAWKLGSFEREAVRVFLGMTIPPPIRPAATERSPRERVETLLRDQVTWTNLLYLLLKLPLGILTATIAVVAIGFAVQLAAGAIGSAFHAFFSFWHFAWFGVLWDLFWAAAGILLVLHALNGLAYGVSRFARVMLGPSEAAIRLAASQAETVRERAKAERAEHSRKELIVNVSHELRTPTASIRGHAESLLMGLEAAGANGRGGLPEDQLAHLRTYLGIIHRESVRLGELVDDLLTLARSEADELRLDLEPVDAAGVVAEVHETLAPLAWRDRSVTLIKETPDQLAPVLADRARLLQVLLNLVRNAITHTPAGGIVSLSIEPEGDDRLALVVADTGSGIPPEELEKVFERFYRVDASRSRASGGFGLGLAIVRDLVGAMGGSVGATSTVGEGSAFRVSLRLAAPAGALESPPVQTTGSVSPGLPSPNEIPTPQIVPPSRRPTPATRPR